MIVFKACPRCLCGDLALERVHERIRASCLQCGFAGELKSLYPTAKARLEVQQRAASLRDRAVAA